VNRLCTEIADKYGWAIVNVNLRPYYTEGAKTFGFEIAEQLGWELPKHTIVPTAGGTILPKIYKAYKELITLGLVEDNGPRIYSAQAAGCNPVVTAIHKGIDIIEPQKPNTIAKSIAIGNPADGYYAYQCVTESGGWGESATDREIIDAIKLLGKLEGIWTEPAGGPVPLKTYPWDRIKGKVALMVIHGDQDMNNPIEASQKMAEEAKAAGVDTVYATVPGGVHLTAYLVYAKQIFDFMDAHKK
jgi:threonine synthase